MPNQLASEYWKANQTYDGCGALHLIVKFHGATAAPILIKSLQQTTNASIRHGIVWAAASRADHERIDPGGHLRADLEEGQSDADPKVRKVARDAIERMQKAIRGQNKKFEETSH